MMMFSRIYRWRNAQKNVVFSSNFCQKSQYSVALNGNGEYNRKVEIECFALYLTYRCVEGEICYG